MNLFKRNLSDKDTGKDQSIDDAEKQTSILHARYEKLKKLGFPFTSFETLYSERCDDVISDEMMEFLQGLTSEDNVLVGIHRTGNASLEDIESILTYGLIIGTLNENTTNTPIRLFNNVSYYPDNKTIIKEIINADAHKGSLGAILIRIPDEDLSENLFFVDAEAGNFILDPKYVIGFIPVEAGGHIKEIITPNSDLSDGLFKGLNVLYEDRDYAAYTTTSFGSKK